MYVNLEGKEIDITTMTKSFIVNAIERYDALCTAKNLHFEEVRKLKETRESLKVELAFRLKRKFRAITD